MKFIDSTEIHIAAGRGGDGMLSFRAARNKPKLGPDGGNGGIGGDVLLRAEASLNTLSSLRYRQMYDAEPGGKGGTNNCTGRCGRPKVIAVPLGTIVYDRESGEKLGELLNPQQELLVAKGGSRGYGNLHFASATNRAPQKATPGKKGERRTLKLELKLLADVGLAGFPNAGKSTLLSRISAARPKIADYPFTTLVPQLGVVDLQEFGDIDSSFVVADIPGLIEGASEGRGLGHDFLRHLERTQVVAYVLDAFDLEGRQPFAAYQMVQKELQQYSPELSAKPAIIVLNKADLAGGDETIMADLLAPFQEAQLECLVISAVTGYGIKELKHRLYERLQEGRHADAQHDQAKAQ